MAILLILIIVFLACFLYKKHKKNNEEAKIQSSDMEKKPIESNGRVKEGTRGRYINILGVMSYHKQKQVISIL